MMWLQVAVDLEIEKKWGTEWMGNKTGKMIIILIKVNQKISVKTIYTLMMKRI